MNIKIVVGVDRYGVTHEKRVVEIDVEALVRKAVAEELKDVSGFGPHSTDEAWLDYGETAKTFIKEYL